MSKDGQVELIGRVSRNPYADITVAVTRHRGRLYIALETVNAETGRPSDPEHPRIFSLHPATVRELLPLLSEAQELAVRIGERG